jgi:hypothetical protein
MRTVFSNRVDRCCELCEPCKLLLVYIYVLSNEHSRSPLIDGRFNHVPVVFIGPVISHSGKIFIARPFTIRPDENRSPRVCNSLPRILNEVSVYIDLERLWGMAECCVNVREGSYIRFGMEYATKYYYR